MKQLSESIVKNAKPKDKRYTISEDGLILEVNPSGKKVFFHKFRQDGKQQKPKIGEYPTISFKEAKQLVLDKKHAVQIRGIKQPILNATFKDFVEGEFKEWLFANNKSAKDSYKTIQTHFMPLLGHIKIKDIEPRIIEGWKNMRLNNSISAATVTRNLTELRAIFTRIEDWHKLPTFMPSVKNPRITTEKEKGSTPIPRTVLKHSQTSHLAEQPFFSFEDYGIAQYSQINPLWQNPRLGNAFGLSVLF